MSRQTPLHDVHSRLGAFFTDFAGWSMPVRYSSEIAEHNAVRTTAGIFDLSHMGEIELEGPDAGVALDYALVGHPSKIGIGRARYTMICDQHGGIIDDLVVYRLSNERFMIVANASNVEVVFVALQERVAGFGALLHDASDEWVLIAVQGPASPGILSEVADIDVSTLKYYSIDPAQLAGREVLLARTGYTGEDGFEVYCTPSDAEHVWNALSQEGGKQGLLPAGLACRDTLRLEAGMPLYGHELSRDVTPFEPGLGRVVAFDKGGAFVGKQALADRRDQGWQKSLVGLTTSGRRVPRAGHPVLNAAGEAVGHVTSGAPSPTLGQPIAMAYVPTELAAPGTDVVIDVRGVPEPARVTELPFYQRKK